MQNTNEPPVFNKSFLVATRINLWTPAPSDLFGYFAGTSFRRGDSMAASEVAFLAPVPNEWIVDLGRQDPREKAPGKGRKNVQLLAISTLQKGMLSLTIIPRSERPPIAYDHTTLNIRELVRSRKSSSVGPGQYLDRRRLGNPSHWNGGIFHKALLPFNVFLFMRTTAFISGPSRNGLLSAMRLFPRVVKTQLYTRKPGWTSAVLRARDIPASRTVSRAPCGMERDVAA
uniref:Uncharacterized protein n=1 Tax=Steinernema glaseri TaxID=37863 RepID=A0A1I7Z4T6_9BILA